MYLPALTPDRGFGLRPALVAVFDRAFRAAVGVVAVLVVVDLDLPIVLVAGTSAAATRPRLVPLIIFLPVAAAEVDLPGVLMPEQRFARSGLRLLPVLLL